MKKFIKKELSIGMVICLIVVFSLQNVNSIFAYAQEVENKKQEQIEGIFQEINQISVEKAQEKYLEELGVNSYSNQRSVKQLERDKRENELDLLLADLGVNKIDVNDESDMAILAELSEESISDSTIELQSDPFDSAPDLAALANAFTLYIYNGTGAYSYNGESHIYRYIRVVDNKGNNGLTLSEEYDGVEKNVTQEVITSVLGYWFGYRTSKFFGKIPGKVDVDFLLGSIFSVLEGIENANGIITSTSDNLYRIICVSVTQLTYYYYYNDPLWKLIGTSATVEVDRTDVFAGNVNGSAVTESHEFDSWTSTTGDGWQSYINAYADVKDKNPNFQKIDELGTLEIIGYQKTFQFAPKFYALPGYILIDYM